jgi:ribonuclease-3
MSEELCRYLGYQFKNIKLLKLALTHCSSDIINNERLEFLGDSIVNFIIADALYAQFPRAQEGDLSRLRASLVNRDALGNLARELQIGRFIYLGPGELKSGGNERLSILSCTMEALIGAIYLDAGFTVTRECVLRWYGSLLNTMTKTASHKDPKTQLQEQMQKLHSALPVYKVLSLEGESHQQLFVVSCTISKMAKQSLGKGSSRRRAEQAAAELMLEMIKNEKK